MDRLDALRVFCAVVQAGGFSKAAARIGISTSSVTNQVGALEDHFGIKLLNRTTRSMSLTAEGRQCHDQALTILASMGDMEDLLRDSHSAPRGSLRVDMPGLVSRLYVAPALPGFLAAYPDISLRLSASDRLVDMIDEGVDVLVRIGDLADSNLVAKVLCHTSYVTCAAPAYVARHGAPSTPDQLAQYDCLAFLYPKARQVRPWQFQRGEQKLSLVPVARLTLDHVDSLIEAALAGCGIIQALSISVDAQLRSGALVPLLSDWRAAGPDVSALYGKQHLRAAKVKLFVDFLSQLFDGHNRGA
jgi:LysR family transcriptional regulator for bpeEF and oprC